MCVFTCVCECVNASVTSFSFFQAVGDDLEMVKMPPPDTDSFVGGAPPYQHQVS